MEEGRRDVLGRALGERMLTVKDGGGALWGPGPLPASMEPIGEIEGWLGGRKVHGLLLRSPDGRYWEGAAGALRGLPDMATVDALVQRDWHLAGILTEGEQA